MSVTYRRTATGITENGQIRLKSKIRLPDNTKVYVVVPGIQVDEIAHIYSPRLAHQEEASDRL